MLWSLGADPRPKKAGCSAAWLPAGARQARRAEAAGDRALNRHREKPEKAQDFLRRRGGSLFPWAASSLSSGP